MNSYEYLPKNIFYRNCQIFRSVSIIFLSTDKCNTKFWISSNNELYKESVPQKKDKYPLLVIIEQCINVCTEVSQLWLGKKQNFFTSGRYKCQVLTELFLPQIIYHAHKSNRWKICKICLKRKTKSYNWHLITHLAVRQ